MTQMLSELDLGVPKTDTLATFTSFGFMVVLVTERISWFGLSPLLTLLKSFSWKKMNCMIVKMLLYRIEERAAATKFKDSR